MRYCDQGSHGSDPAADGSCKADIYKPLNRTMTTYPWLMGLGNPLVSDHQTIMAQYETIDTDSSLLLPKTAKSTAAKNRIMQQAHTLCSLNLSAIYRRATTP